MPNQLSLETGDDEITTHQVKCFFLLVILQAS